jgi:hypothetical protein
MVVSSNPVIRVLVACEESQAVTIYLRALGVEAHSCDLLPCSGGHPEWHFQRDCFEVIEQKGPWDMLIAFPPCTHLAASGAQYWDQKKLDGRQKKAIDFALRLYYSNVPRVCIENPVGILSSKWMKPMQMIEPYQFGDAFTKKTCLWLKNLPHLQATERVKPEFCWCSTSKGGKLPYKKGTGYNAFMRSKTFPGIAKAMASQWGKDRLVTQLRINQMFDSF